MRTLDVVPTIADLLGTRPRWRHDGRSAFAPVTSRRREVASAHARLQQGDPHRPARAATAKGGQPPPARRARGHGGGERPALRLPLGGALPRGLASRAGRTRGERPAHRAGRSAERRRGERRPAASRERGRRDRPHARDRQDPGRTAGRPARRGGGRGRAGVGDRPQLPPRRAPLRVLLAAHARGVTAAGAQPRSSCSRCGRTAGSRRSTRASPPAGSATGSGRARPPPDPCSRR